MMKKLLMLVLVLGIASMASAGLKLVGIPTEPIEPSDIVRISVVNDAPIIGGFAGGVGIVIGSGPGSWTGAWGTPGMPNPMNGNNFAEYYGDVSGILGPWDFYYMDLTSPVTTPFPPKEWFWAEFHCDGPGDVTIVLTDFDGVVIDQAVIHQIPEPASMLLLGLGGLFLRRK